MARSYVKDHMEKLIDLVKGYCSMKILICIGSTHENLGIAFLVRAHFLFQNLSINLLRHK